MAQAWYWDDYREYEASAPERVIPARIFDERAATHPLDPWYFYQDVWAFRRVMEVHPPWHLDVGSTALLVGVLAQLVPVVSVDVRPLPVTLDGLTCRQGDVTALPFADGEVPMASSLSVIEHVGLGRYGDAIDVHGSERACGELQRVLRPGGRLLLSVPLAKGEPVTLFNAHRLLTKAQVSRWLDGCRLVGEREICGDGMTVWLSEWERE